MVIYYHSQADFPQSDCFYFNTHRKGLPGAHITAIVTQLSHSISSPLVPASKEPHIVALLCDLDDLGGPVAKALLFGKHKVMGWILKKER